MPAGYYRSPTIHGDQVVFTSEDDLWTVPLHGGLARRLTSNLGEVAWPMFSSDGQYVAFVGREEGAPEVYVMAAAGGSARRLTYLSSNCRVLGWMPDGRHIVFSSNYGQVIASEYGLFQVNVDGANGEVSPLPFGPARSITFGAAGEVVLGRNTGDPARWKRYRGGTAGHLWIDRTGDGHFQRLLGELQGNIASPMWIANGGQARVFFVSDHEGIGNLYSVTPDGADLQRHTDHEDYYVRNPSADGARDGGRIVYHAGADLYVYPVGAERSQLIEVEYRSPRVQRNRKFAPAGRYMDHARLHPSGDVITVTARGKSFTFYNFDGPVVQQGKRDGVRYRLTDWLSDGRRMVLISDELGEEALEVHGASLEEPPQRLEGLDMGRATELKASPTEDKVAIANHRHELLVVDLETAQLTVVDRSPFRRIAGFDWSPDGRWLAYGFSATQQTTAIRLAHVPGPAVPEDASRDAPGETGQEQAAQAAPTGWTVHTITQPVLHDVAPSFDPEGKYLYFLSHREFNPVYDGLHFDLGFPWGMRPYLVTLRADLPNPFVPHPELAPDDGQDAEEEDEDEEEAGPDDEAEDEDAGDDADGAADEDEGEEPPDDGLGRRMYLDGQAVFRALRVRRDAEATEEAEQPEAGAYFDHAAEAAISAKGKGREKKPRKPRDRNAVLQIDLDGIDRRVVAFPVQDGRYGQVAGIKGKALFTEFALRGQMDDDDGGDDDEETDGGALRAYTFADFKSETLVEGLSWFDLARNGKKLIYGINGRLRVINAGDKPPSGSGHPRKTGWVSLNRVKVSVDAQGEWEQMFREAWRLQRDHFWTEDMSEVDWETVYSRYFPLIERVSTRSEFSDLMWEMQGELGTSHAYEFGGDYRPSPHYSQGFLGAQFRWDAGAGGYRVEQLVLGDPWDMQANSPLADPGVDVKPGDVLLAVNGQPLDAATGPAQLLVNQAGHDVLLTLAPRPAADDGQDGSPPASEPAAADPDQPQAGAEAPRSRYVVVRTIRNEAPARYRAWVEANRRLVHQASQGRAGYVHIPDMSARGYAEFHRGYLAEIDRDGLIVDVRYNGGGHVSQLILEKLARRRIGYDISRWGGLMPYPLESIAGPIVALTNENAGSDGDIFCHSFKLMKLGPLIGKRTWGGVIGIWPRHSLVDGTVTTQPEYSFWFEDVGWNVENYGTDPDIEVDISPQDFVAGRDPQLDRAVAEALHLLAAQPILKPDLASRPSRALPKLPPRMHKP